MRKNPQKMNVNVAHPAVFAVNDRILLKLYLNK